MKNLDWEENNMCKFNFCPYYDFEKEECIFEFCKIKLDKNNGK